MQLSLKSEVFVELDFLDLFDEMIDLTNFQNSLNSGGYLISKTKGFCWIITLKVFLINFKDSKTILDQD